MKDTLRIGIFGGRRGAHLGKEFMLLGCSITAVCETRKNRQDEMRYTFGRDIAVYDNFCDFIDCGKIDAVILANNFHEHAPYAIECFKRNIHVFSECISNGTMAEGVELIRAAENTSSVYMLAENYPQMLMNREIARICSDGSLGKILYAEGEYNHPVDPEDKAFFLSCINHEKHWRNYLPRTYYVTHSLAPLIRATGAMPMRVTAMASFAPFEEDTMSRYTADRAAIMTTINDDGSVFRFTGCAAFGAHHLSYRVCGTNGQIENVRGMGEKVMLRYNSWSIPEGKNETELYMPDWNDRDEELIKQSGHGGGDYLTARLFLECVRENKQPPAPFDLHSAVRMSSVGILAHRSVLEMGTPYDIPDLTKEEDIKKYENDRLTPFWSSDGTPPSIPCCSHPDYAPTEEQLNNYRRLIQE